MYPNQSRFIFECWKGAFDQIEEAFSARRAVRAVLNVVGRPNVLGRLGVAFIEQRVKCFENTFFVFRFRRLVHRSPRRSVLGAGANAPLEKPDCTDTANSILPEDVGIVLIESVAIWSFRRAYLARKLRERSGLLVAPAKSAKRRYAIRLLSFNLRLAS